MHLDTKTVNRVNPLAIKIALYFSLKKKPSSPNIIPRGNGLLCSPFTKATEFYNRTSDAMRPWSRRASSPIHARVKALRAGSGDGLLHSSSSCSVVRGVCDFWSFHGVVSTWRRGVSIRWHVRDVLKIRVKMLEKLCDKTPE